MPQHSENMQTSVKGIYVAGDTAGVEEASTAMDEGRLAGISIAESLGYLTAKESADRQEETRQRLMALRMGPFGDKRRNAKDRIMGGGC